MYSPEPTMSELVVETLSLLRDLVESIHIVHHIPHNRIPYNTARFMRVAYTCEMKPSGSKIRARCTGF